MSIDTEIELHGHTYDRRVFNLRREQLFLRLTLDAHQELKHTEIGTEINGFQAWNLGKQRTRIAGTAYAQEIHVHGIAGAGSKLICYCGLILARNENVDYVSVGPDDAFGASPTSPEEIIEFMKQPGHLFLPTESRETYFILELSDGHYVNFCQVCGVLDDVPADESGWPQLRNNIAATYVHKQLAWCDK